MSDIFQEVDADLRRERMKRVWDRYGIYVILVAVLIVVVTAGYRGYDAWQTSRARSAGDQFAAVLTEAETAASPQSAERLLAFAADAPEGYALLATFRAASQYAEAGVPEKAAALLRDLAADRDVPELYRGLATIRLGQILLNEGDYDGAAAAVGPLAEDSASPWTRSAQELMGLVAYARDDMGEARRWFSSIAEAAGIPPDLQQRAGLMLALIDQSSPGSPAPDDAAAAQETN